MVNIRRAVPADARELCELHKASIRALCSPSYSPDHIEAWTGQLEPDRYLSAIEKFDFFVAEDSGLLGFVILNIEGSELNALYILPEATGRGVGSELLAFAEDLARSRSVETLKLKATLNAAGFYQSRGFEPLRRALHTSPAGIGLPCIEMSKTL